jgi:Rrf2 family protein
MNFNKTTEYALQILAYLAEQKGKIISSAELHTKLKIPKKYLQALLTKLSKHKLVKSTYGRAGGFILAKKSRNIFLSDIVNAIEGFNTNPSCIFGFGSCVLQTPCAMHDKWSDLQNQRNILLQSTRLSDVIVSDNF